MGDYIALIFDAVMAIVLVFFIWRGFIRGFSGEIISFVGLFVALFCAWNFLEPAIDLVRKFLPSLNLDDTILSIICGVIIFFGVEIIFAIIGGAISYIVRVAELSIMDHFLGLIIGVVKTFLIIIFIYAVIASFPGLIPEESLEKSYCMKAASFVWPPVRDFLTQVGIFDLAAITGRK